MTLTLQERYERLFEDIRPDGFDLTQHVQPQALPEARFRLKTTPKVVQPKLNLADYVQDEATPPPAVDRTARLGNPCLRDVLGNDQWGDCGDAMAIHGIEAFHIFNQTPVPSFVTDDALRLYTQVSGFDPNAGPPGQNPTDTGTDNQRLVDSWRDVGVRCAGDGSVHKIAGSLFVDPRDSRVTRIAIFEFVVLFRALALPRTAQGQAPWRLVGGHNQGDAAPGSWGYHDVPYLSYDQQYIHCDTWGNDQLVGWGFDRDYGIQGFVVVTPEMLNFQGVSPSGLDWTRLNQDLAKFPPAK